MPRRECRIISFSGIDGAGKSTQIEALISSLKSNGAQFQVYRFWDDAVAFRKFREKISLAVFRGDKGIGSPEKPIRRRDKNVVAWYLTAWRLVLYTFDALKLRSLVARVRQSESLIIFDRYLYDELANLPLANSFVCSYVRFLVRMVPAPEVALLLDADPESATKRKPEYPLDFVHRNRAAYMSVSRLARMTIVPPGPIDPTSAYIRELLSAKGLQPDMASRAESVEVPYFQAS